MPGSIKARGRYIAFFSTRTMSGNPCFSTADSYLELPPAPRPVYSDGLISGEIALSGHRFMKGAQRDM